jgi:hypothetical protein
MQVQFCLARGRVCVRVRARVYLYLYQKNTSIGIYLGS